MGAAIKKRYDLPDQLFEEDNDEKVKVESFAEEESPSEEMNALVGKMEKRFERRKTKSTVAAASFGRTTLETKKMMESGNYEKCRARHLVAIFDIMHTECYGVEDISLGPKERYKATALAGSFTNREFDGNYVEVVEYLRWVWKREIGREKYRRENKQPNAYRLIWHFIFSRKCLMDYKLFLARTT